jgi:hypothetical protein
MRAPLPPLPNSYWVERGRLLAGEHPYGGSRDATRRRLELLLAAGVRSFLDLTQAGEVPGYRELLPAEINYANLPIPDHSVPRKPAQMQEILRELRSAVTERAAVYVHCRAGIGRTGTTIGCYLRERGARPDAAVTELNRLWQQNARAAEWPRTPETNEQESYILDWRVQPLKGTHGTGR